MSSTNDTLTTIETITLEENLSYNAIVVYSNTEGIINTTSNIDFGW